MLGKGELHACPYRPGVLHLCGVLASWAALRVSELVLLCVACVRLCSSAGPGKCCSVRGKGRCPGGIHFLCPATTKRTTAP